MNRQYIGARYVPKFAEPVEWDNLRSYEPLTIVTYAGTSYTSKKPVPVGIDLNNTDYWAVTGNYNEQVEEYRNETLKIKDKLTYVLFEEFGAVGNGATDDTKAIKDCIAYAKTNNCIISSKNKTYLISEDITFSNVKAIDLGVLLCLDCKVIIQDASIVKYFTIKNGPLIVDSYYSEVSNFTIKDYDGICLSFQSTSELVDNVVGFDGVHDFMIDNYKLHSKNAVGINCNNNDMKIRNGVIVNCNTGVIYDGGNILLDKIHMWINGYVDFNTSIAFDIRRTGFRIQNCTIDTYCNIFKMKSEYLQGIVNGMNIIHNTTLKPNVNINFINQKYCTILGNITFVMSYWSKNNVTLKLFDNAKCKMNFIDGNPSDNYRLTQSQLTSSYGGTINTSNNITVSGDIVWVDLNITYEGSGMPYGNTDTINFNDLIVGYRIKFSGYVMATYTDNELSTFTNGLALAYIENGNLKITHAYTTSLNLKRIHIQIPMKLLP